MAPREHPGLAGRGKEDQRTRPEDDPKVRTRVPEGERPHEAGPRRLRRKQFSYDEDTARPAGVARRRDARPCGVERVLDGTGEPLEARKSSARPRGAFRRKSSAV